MDDLVKDGNNRLRKFTNWACAISVIFLITLLFVHTGSFENIRAVMNADAAVRDKYRNAEGKLTIRPFGVYLKPGLNERLYVFQFRYGTHQGIVQEQFDGRGFKILEVSEN